MAQRRFCSFPAISCRALFVIFFCGWWFGLKVESGTVSLPVFLPVVLPTYHTPVPLSGTRLRGRSSSRPKREALAVTTNVHTPPSKAATKASQTPRSSNKARGADQAGDDPPFASPRSQMLSEVLVSLSKPKKPRVRNIAGPSVG